MMTGLLDQYNLHEHVPSDIPADHLYLHPSTFFTQIRLDSISEWTDINLMKLNTAKSNYMIFSRSIEEVATRLTLNGVNLEQVHVSKILGLWISEDLSWSRNTKETCIRAYARMSLLTKLKYVGTKTNDLLDVYKLFIRSILEYCSVVFHSSLTQEDVQNLERIQKTSLKVIFGDEYESYESALQKSGLETLHARQETVVPTQ